MDNTVVHMKLNYADKNDVHIIGLKGRPEYYPVPDEEQDVLFYIQRNQNLNTVVYQLNKRASGGVDMDNPINVYWKQYAGDGSKKQINLLQRKLAYGYNSKPINTNTIEFEIVYYPEFKMYLSITENGEAAVLARLCGEWAVLSNIYVFADEFGVFPDVKYIELYGDRKSDGLPVYQKLIVSA